jgi:precorrin-6A/cobalt-precorrin-6A reductase
MLPHPTPADTVLVFGGTTEGKTVAAALGGTSYPFWYSTKTEVATSLPANGRARWGTFTTASLVEFCQLHRVGCIVHASHPFAEQLHATVAAASQQLGLPVLRFERQYPARLAHPLVQYVADYEEVVSQLLAADYAPALALSGVQTIERLRGYWQQRPLFCRILPREASVALARRAGFPVANLITEWPGAGLADEVALLQQTGAQAVITKESGESGFLSVKIAAALQAGVPIFIVRRPALPASFHRIAHADELLALLPSCLHGPSARS